MNDQQLIRELTSNMTTKCRQQLLVIAEAMLFASQNSQSETGDKTNADLHSQRSCKNSEN